jgi:perosamine synthetase
MRVTGDRALYGAASYEGLTGRLPVQFPRTIGRNAMKYLQEVVESGLRGDMVERFERAFAEAVGTKHCIATPGCTAALHAAVLAMELHPGDEVIVSPISDYGTITGLIKEQVIPVFADAVPGTVNLSAETIAPHITDRTRAVLAVHMTGLVCDMDPINALARRHDLFVVEDVCQAVFSRYKGRNAGTMGDAAGFSFDSDKTMGSDGGGCLVTDDDRLAERARFMAHSRGGIVKPAFGRMHVEPGASLRMPQCTAAVTLAQLEIIQEEVAQRDRMVRFLTELLGEISGITPLPIPEYVDSFSPWMVGFSIDPAAFRCSPDEFGRQCADAGIPGIGTARHYLLAASCPFLQEWAAQRNYPYSMATASRVHRYGGDACPNAHAFLETFLRWSTFCGKYRHEDCELAADIVHRVADANRV